ncbi:MAG: FtsX-like permease family protein [Chloroflexi bacterium]|nr:FtsX-like permease family protein [Chloroflexota bacterium]
MENLFGVPMAGLAITLVVILAIASLAIITMALRNRILMKLAIRNIPRRRAQTVLIVVGLMLSTTIISASLAIGDTVTGSIRGVVLDALGHTDLRLRTPQIGGSAESQVFADNPDGTAFFTDRYIDAETLSLVLGIAMADDRIDGIMPQIREILPVLDTRSQLTESRMTVVGFDVERQDGFGDIRTLGGQLFRLDELGDDEVLINESGAEELDARAGDEIVIVSPTGRHSFTTRAVVREGGLAANDHRAIMSLGAMRRIMDREGQVNRIDLSATGGVRDGVNVAKDVAETLRIEFTDPVVAQRLFDVLRTPDVIEILNAYADSGGNGVLSSSAEENLRVLIAELPPGDTVTARRASQVGALLVPLSDTDASEHLLAAIGDKFIAALFAGPGGPGNLVGPGGVLDGPGGVLDRPGGAGQVIVALASSPDGFTAAVSLLDSLVQIGAGADVLAYLEANRAGLAPETAALLASAGEALSDQGPFSAAPDVQVTDVFRSKAADSTLAAHILVAIESSPESSGRRDLVVPVTALFAGLEVLAVDELKRDGLELAELFGNIFLTFFAIFGSFSIIVGLLLIFLVFVMLAASRSTEMGIVRAIGTKRRHLVQMFTYEGFAYALGAALIGTVLGILASLVLVQMMAGIIGEEEDSAFTFQYSFTLTSVVAAFSAGMLLTLATVAVSAYRVSRLNIVVAIRDLPQELVPSDTPPLLTRLIRVGQAVLGPIYYLYRAVTAHRRQEGAVFPVAMLLLHLLILPWLILAAVALFRVFQPYLAIGWPLVILGVLLALWGVSIDQAAPWRMGVSLTLVGAGLMIRLILRRSGLREEFTDRMAYTFMGATVLVFWALPFDALNWLTGELSAGVEMFILSGTWMVASAVWLLMYNADLIARGLEAAFGGSPQVKAILKPAIAYPMQAKFRTGLTVAMFSLVIFTMMVFAILNGIGSDLDETPDRVTGGFDIRAETSIDLPVTDIESAIERAPNLDPADFVVIAAHTDIPAEARQPGADERRFRSLGVRGAERRYLEETLLEITHFDPAYLPADTPLDDPAAVSRAVWNALAADPSLAIVSADLLESDGGGFRFGGAEFSIEGLAQHEDGPIEAVDLELRQIRGRGAVITRTVIGAMDLFAETFEFDGGPVANLITRADIFEDLSGESIPLTTFRIRLRDGADAGRIAAAMETAFLDNSMEAIDTLDEIKIGISQNNAFNRLFQGFMGLGLVVGVASLGVLSFRAVVERRHAIGMMRAIGYKSRMIQVQFLLESMFVTVLGSALGVGLGALISWNIINDFGDRVEGISFDIPWLTVSTIVAVAMVASLVTTYIPARQASRIYPAEALRYE